jgi:hypothetical protein
VTLHCRKKKTYSGMKPPYRSDRKYLQDYYLRQAGHGYPVHTGGRFQRGNGLGSIFGGLFKAAMPLLKSGAKTLDREALKTGLSIAGDVVQRKNLKQAAKIRLKTTRQQMLQRALAQSGPPDERTMKRNALQKKIQKLSDQTSSENGPRAPSIMRIYQIEIELVRGTTHPDQRVAPILRTKRLEVNPDGSRSLRIRCERRRRRLDEC